MLLKNTNNYNIMYGLEFIKADEVKEFDDKEDKKIIDLLLNQPGIEEYIDKKQAKALEAENAKLKAQLEEKEELSDLDKAKQKADELGIVYAKNIGLKSLLKKIEDFENK